MTPEIKPAHPGRLPCVDGWRALSICLVLGAHSLAMTGFPGDNPLVSCFPLLVDGNLGVRFFFVISGFLITYLLIEEQARNGDISLTKFYIRRALRILPVYLMYLAVVAALQLFTSLHQSWITWIGDLTFTCNFLPRGIVSGHLWSLSVEEQFYFLWPVTFIWLNRRRQYLVPALAAPIVVALLFHTVVYAQKVPWIIHPLFHPHSSFVNFDSLAVGCATAFALAQWRHRITGWLTRRNRLLAAAAGVGLVLLPSLDLAVARPVWAIFGNLFQAAGLALLLLTSALQPRGFAPLSWRVVVQLGVVSYSIYVWQQIFYAAPDIYATRNIWWLSFPMWLVPVLLVSFASYYGFERPLLKLRTRFRRTVL